MKNESINKADMWAGPLALTVKENSTLRHDYWKTRMIAFETRTIVTEGA
ncbi:hypothetical protein NQ095_08285 [Rossellomorea sp. SC111]|nr:hypothetical protein [Rossellomorea sp. SC111]MCR8848396.1 hypothetical protein [Rossellomorea sp. SC111]